MLVMASLVSSTRSFGIARQPQHKSALSLATTIPDISDVLNGESCVDELSEQFFEGSEISANGDDEVSAFAPPLTYEKYLTMQVIIFP